MTFKILYYLYSVLVSVIITVVLMRLIVIEKEIKHLTEGTGGATHAHSFLLDRKHLV